MNDPKDRDGARTRTERWEILSSDELFSHPYFRFRKDRCALPDERIMPAYFVMEFVDWVNVVPLTEDGQIVLVNQYRHAARRRFYEFPGGTLEPDNPDETPEAAATRELLEETGYAAGRMNYLGLHYPNPGLQDNRMHVFLGTGCRKLAEPKLDTYEDLEVELVDVQEFLQCIEQGRPMHSLMMASLTLALPAIKRHYSVSSLAL
ncbi:MAG: NUDIX hydrolase [Gammaproteobacteria bacterium]|nr:NUDIX hydrolase [Gammaproteobacteria bacterium]